MAKTIPELTDLNPVEKSRTYYFPILSNCNFGGISIPVTINNVCKLGQTQSGKHILEDTAGKKYIINNNWLYIEINVEAWT